MPPGVEPESLPFLPCEGGVVYEVCDPVRTGGSVDVTRLSMTELLSRLRRGELSPVELVESHIGRIEAVNGRINALVAERFERARAEAAEAEREYATASRPRPLLGIPFSVKEMIELEGMPLTFGSRLRRTVRSARDATVVARLRHAGAIPLGVTNVPEWGMWFETYNGVYGRTRNPHDLRRTPGGSSGGEGALVAAGGSVFGVGADIGGSIRIPAAFCGVFGHKPTTGLLPLTGHYPVYASGPEVALEKEAPYLTLGPLTRSARDIAPLVRAMAGRDGVDPNAEPVAFLDPERVEWAGRRVLLLPSPSIERTAAAGGSVSAAVERAGRLLEERGAVVEYAPARLLEHAGDIWFGALQSAAVRSFSETIGGGERIQLPLELMRTVVGLGRYTWPALFFCLGERIGAQKPRALAHAERQGRRLLRQFRGLLGEDGVLVSPVHPRTAPRHNAAVLRPFDFLYTAVFNAMRVPATSAPCGLDAHGLPLAVQFSSVRGNDHVTIAAASVIEDGAGGWSRPAL